MTHLPRPERSVALQERLDRQFAEVLQELRVALPGVQLLFGFLLIVPFNSRFADVTEIERGLYLVALLSAALSSALLIAPAAYHRMVFQRGDRPRVIAMAARCLIAGLASLATAMIASAGLITSLVFSDLVAALATAAVATTVLGLWFALPVWRNLTRP